MRSFVAPFLIVHLVSPALAQTAPAKMTSEQAREERAYAAGIQVALWGRPFVDIAHTFAASLKAGATGLSYFRKFPNLKTAADKFVNTPNNVSIDGYGAADLASEPVVVSVPAIKEKRWYIIQIGDFDFVFSGVCARYIA